mmetsp:Transcript_23133/g.61791  ORF Transcript_23133/g.61791 Transcript_23133/m.61791 type:complete len:241 (+) Transcript_23133:1601-2323(+)
MSWTKFSSSGSRETLAARMPGTAECQMSQTTWKLLASSSNLPGLMPRLNTPIIGRPPPLLPGAASGSGWPARMKPASATFSFSCTPVPTDLTCPEPYVFSVSGSSAVAVYAALARGPASSRSPLDQNTMCSRSGSAGSGNAKAAWRPVAALLVFHASKSALNTSMLPGQIRRVPCTSTPCVVAAEAAPPSYMVRNGVCNVALEWWWSRGWWYLRGRLGRLGGLLGGKVGQGRWWWYRQAL